MRSTTVRGFAVLALLLPGLALADDPCPTAGPVDRLADLAAHAAAADPAPWPRKERNALLAARAVLEGRVPGLLGGCEALAAAARRLEAVVAETFTADLQGAFTALRADFAVERNSVEGLFPRMAPARVALLRRKLDGSYEKAGILAGEGRLAAAAAALLRAARVADGIRNPRVPVYGGPLRVVSINLENTADVRLNEPVVIQFSDRVDPATVRADSIQVREGPNFGVQVPGTLVVKGPLVHFLPRLPTKADLSDAGFRPGTSYRVQIAGVPQTSIVREKGGDPVAKPYTAQFSTTNDPARPFTSAPFADDPPPRVACTSPADVLPAAPWDDPGGAKEVPADAPIVLTFNRVPLLPSTVGPDDVTLTMTEFHGEPVARRILGTPVLTQDFDSVHLEFQPRVPLPDRSRFVLQLSSRVADLTGAAELPAHPGRSALYAAASADPSGPLGVLAAAHTLEFEPRTFLVFTTRDEPAQDREVALEFDGTDVDVEGGDGNDAAGTTASFNGDVPGAVSAVVNVARGNGNLLDFHPFQNVVLDTSSIYSPGGVFEFRSITIPAGVTVYVEGPLPAILRCQGDVRIDGTLFAGGYQGATAESGYTSAGLGFRQGGAAGPGGAAGGSCSTDSAYGLAGGSGASVPGGGIGGGGGFETASTASYSFAGGGGGGGHAAAGAPGTRGTYAPTSSPWNGDGGAGGSAGGPAPDGSATDGGRTFASTGGAGGGAGGNSHYTPYGWRSSGAGGGGGGGAILLTAGGDIRVSGAVHAGGGAGGDVVPGNSYFGGAPGGGGAGGSIALYSERDIDVTGAILRAAGGPPGSLFGVIWVGGGGAGGDGFIRLEDRDGAVAGLAGASSQPNAAAGTYRPLSSAADGPTVFRSTWFALPAVRPEILPFAEGDFVEEGVQGCSVRWEIQGAVEHPALPGRPDLAPVDPGTGASSDPARASGWLLLRDTAGGIRDLSADLGGRGYEYFRIRASFTLADGLGPADAKPALDRFRVRFRHRQ